KALRKHYINPTKKSNARFRKEYGTLTPELLAEAIAQMLSIEDKEPGEWQDIIAEHKAALEEIIQSTSNHQDKVALYSYINNHKGLEEISEEHAEARQKIQE